MTTSTESFTVDGVFASPQRLNESFDGHLLGLLDEDSLGAFVLVLANLCFEQAMFDRLRGPAAAAFARWVERFDAADPLVTRAPADDVAVFRQLRELGFDRLGVTRWRRVGPWELQFNPLRALRPPRMSQAVVETLHKPFDTGGFHFNRPFLRREIFREGMLGDARVRLLFNKFPFAERHLLLVPHPQDCRPQYLNRADHELVWRLAGSLGCDLPGLGFGYNAQGAYASVNHLHFQMFVRSQGYYPIEAPHWCHNGGDRDYPLPVWRYTGSTPAWDCIQELHADGIPYNLLYRPGMLYVVERARQGSYRHSAWSGGFAWSEIAGSVTTADPVAFERLSEPELAGEFARLRIRP